MSGQPPANSQKVVAGQQQVLHNFFKLDHWSQEKDCRSIQMFVSRNTYNRRLCRVVHPASGARASSIAAQNRAASHCVRWQPFAVASLTAKTLSKSVSPADIGAVSFLVAFRSSIASVFVQPQTIRWSSAMEAWRAVAKCVYVWNRISVLVAQHAVEEIFFDDRKNFSEITRSEFSVSFFTFWIMIKIWPGTRREQILTLGKSRAYTPGSSQAAAAMLKGGNYLIFVGFDVNTFTQNFASEPSSLSWKWWIINQIFFLFEFQKGKRPYWYNALPQDPVTEDLVWSVIVSILKW